jgi:predicted Zn-dependent protease
VIFDGKASGQVFASLLGPGLAGRPDPIGSRRRRDVGLDKRLGKRILPRSFQVYDDPTVKRFDGEALFGWYLYDDEAVPARRVNLVKGGVLETMLTSRAPTRKVQGSTGHGRSGQFGVDARAASANLFLSCDEGVTDEELKQALIELCEDEDYEFGLRITSLTGVGRGQLPDPLVAYKVYVADGREELVRGLEFKPVQLRMLRKIEAAGKTPYVFNHLSQGPAAVVSPAVLFEELELEKVEEEFDKLPILHSPATREKTVSSAAD